MERVNYVSNSPWESTVGYSRLIKCGPLVFISGTTSIDEKGNVIGLKIHTYRPNKLFILLKDP
jgi:enamine deaminase RidA (YjgF/YER057c/UK114 family)